MYLFYIYINSSLSKIFLFLKVFKLYFIYFLYIFYKYIPIFNVTEIHGYLYIKI